MDVKSDSVQFLSAVGEDTGKENVEDLKDYMAQ